MRIISGEYKNRKIHFTKLNIRPTTDFAKESLFNLLNNNYDLNSIYVLDLFAGSGNISYEFISRGAKQTTAIDNNIKCIKFIEKTKHNLEMKNFNIIYSNTISYLKKDLKKYDVIFLDPPYTYTQTKYNQIIELILDKNMLNNYGSIIIEHSKFINFEIHKNFFQMKKYGKVHFTFLKYEK